VSKYIKIWTNLRYLFIDEGRTISFGTAVSKFGSAVGNFSSAVCSFEAVLGNFGASPATSMQR
jgi:hypothetical protein